MGLKHITYDTMEKVKSHWEMCDAIRSTGVNTSDSKVVGAIVNTLLGGEKITQAFAVYREKIGD
jgi:hypothetical protein